MLEITSTIMSILLDMEVSKLKVRLKQYTVNKEVP